MNDDIIEIFFSCDEAYVPYLATAIHSLKDNRDKTRSYRITVLHAGISDVEEKRILDVYSEYKFEIQFYNIEPSLKKISERLHTRDYYSKSTYYRLFIPELFPEIEKALYFDCDVIITSDISELFDTPLENKLLGAIPDSFVMSSDKLALYAKNRIGHESAKDYFNAGVLIMNLEKMRKINFTNLFIELLCCVTFSVAQDQDYLNIISMGDVLYLGVEWNYMPLTNENAIKPKLIHFNLDNKPWHKNGVPYANLFYSYAKKTPYSDIIIANREGFTEKMQKKAASETERLIETAYKEALDVKENKEIKEKVRKIIHGGMLV